jgi:hypothetical protein
LVHHDLLPDHEDRWISYEQATGKEGLVEAYMKGLQQYSGKGKHLQSSAEKKNKEHKKERKHKRENAMSKGPSNDGSPDSRQHGQQDDECPTIVLRMTRKFMNLVVILVTIALFD